ncbi:unnamed protein product [Periconia digitata]|uniref:Transcriptional regulator n=1 Tax=Periconia digitata TaxID=1303443 RepID=A0A9W4XKH3_9PLEO|nr:unnamed protein product [Periconia digitata]
MSDSESAYAPSEADISRALIDAVVSIYKSGNEADLTIKRVRARVETEFGLPSGLLKKPGWGDKTRTVITEAVEKYCQEDAEELPTPPPKETKKAPKEKTQGVKRKAAATPKKALKRRKPFSSDEESELSEEEPPKKPAWRQKKVVEDEESDGEEETRPVKAIAQEEDGEDDGDVAMQTPPPAKAQDEGSDSEMSVLIDESPVKKRQKSSQKPAKEKKKVSAPKTTKAKPASKVDDDPNQAEIKRLQGWLVKCGIRKVWGKELAKCDTPKDKIRHLKGLLSDAGMEGKFSVEKAAKIKEQREFAKDLEEIQAGEAAWGKQEVTQTGRPRRAANRPPPKVEFPKFSDDEEEEEGTGNVKAGRAQDDRTDDDDDDDDDGDAEDSEASASGADDDDSE